MAKPTVKYFGSMEAGGATSPYQKVKGVYQPMKTAPKKAAPAKKAPAKFSPVKFKNAQKKVFGMK